MGQRYNKKAKTGDCVFQKVGKLGRFGRSNENERLQGTFLKKISLQPFVFREIFVFDGNQTSLMISIPILMASSFIGIR